MKVIFCDLILQKKKVLTLHILTHFYNFSKLKKFCEYFIGILSKFVAFLFTFEESQYSYLIRLTLTLNVSKKGDDSKF